jgi:hypothetical protein
MTGLYAPHLLELAVRPALQIIGGGTAAEQLVMGTAAVESNLIWLKQHGTGPALGLWQMEPFTFHDLTNRLTDAQFNTLMSLSTHNRAEPDELAWNLRFGAAMCRIKYRDDPRPLPQAGDIQGMAATWKRCYNSHLGAGKPEDFIRAWGNLIAPNAARMWP